MGHVLSVYSHAFWLFCAVSDRAGFVRIVVELNFFDVIFCVTIYSFCHCLSEHFPVAESTASTMSLSCLCSSLHVALVNTLWHVTTHTQFY